MNWDCFNVYDFPCPWKTSFTISCKVGLLVRNSPSFCYCEKLFISSSCSKDNFAGFRILDWWYFSSQHIKYLNQLSSSLHGFWWEAQHNSYPCSLIALFFFSVFFQDLIFVFGFLQFEHDKPICCCCCFCCCHCCCFHIYPDWQSLSFLDLLFNQFWKILSYYYFKYFFFLLYVKF